MQKRNEYKPVDFESKWAKEWEERKMYLAVDNQNTNKSYVLIEFPYPSGERLHVGHARSYSCLDAVARMRRMKGKNVLFPFGWDAFGLPAENYAIKTGIHPAITTRQNIENSKLQAISWGLSFDWSREVNTTDSNYYKWTQWIFTQLFIKGLAYKDEIAVNWCPSCKINLANEEVIDGKCERCGTQTERRKQSQWLLKITAYADRLLEDLKTVDYREDIAAQQVNWIGRKEGARVKFKVVKISPTNPPLYQRGERKEEIYLEVFTTRLDTLYGVTFIVVAPEIVREYQALIPGENQERVDKYVTAALNKSERERKQKGEKSGVDTGIKAINPANGKEIPVWVAEYVMMDIGTGVVMGVPAHDQRDFDFAINNRLPVVQVIAGKDVSEKAFEGEGKLINSGKYDGLESVIASKMMIDDGLGVKDVHYHLRDWVFSRQHYWGEPIPMIYCPKCANRGDSWFTKSPLNPSLTKEGETKGEISGVDMAGWYPVDESDLPVKLPDLEKFQPTGTGESPLAHVSSFVNTACPKCGGKARRETDTMPNWAGSSWYFLRYCDPHNNEALADKDKLKYWLPVDWYNGGMEHTTLHLLYSRFWHKFLYDLGVVPTIEPYAKRTSHGVVLGVDGRKMSKSKGNVINPDEVVAKYGADTLRLYEMFIGPFDQMVIWSWEGVEGTYRFLKKVWNLTNTNMQSLCKTSREGKFRLARLIKKVEEDLENTKFNTAVAACMEFVNWWAEHPGEMGKEDVIIFLKVIAPMAPFIAEELYQRLVTKSAKPESIHVQLWPDYNPGDLQAQEIEIVVQVDGKVRGFYSAKDSQEKNEVERRALELENVAKFVGSSNYRTVFVPNKIINFITK